MHVALSGMLTGAWYEQVYDVFHMLVVKLKCLQGPSILRVGELFQPQRDQSQNERCAPRLNNSAVQSA